MQELGGNLARVGAVIGAAIWVALGAGSALATPSFDCALASTEDEIAICAHSHLARLDDQVAAGYADARRERGGAFISRYGRALLDERRLCGGDIGCIEEAQRYAISAYAVLNPKSGVQPSQILTGERLSPLLRAWSRANAECQLGSDTAMSEGACTLREVVIAPMLSARDLCPGRYEFDYTEPGAATLLRNRWVPCLYYDLTEPD